MIKPDVTVILPVYNTDDKYIKAIDSVLKQTYADFELIVIDDNSPKCVCVENFGDARIKLLTRSESGGGPSLARNDGLHAATGKYITFLDADDTYEPCFLSYMIMSMQNGNDYVTCQFYVKQGAEKYVYRANAPDKQCEINDLNIFAVQNMRFISASVWNAMFRADIIEREHIEFVDNKYLFEEDVAFTYQYLSYCKNMEFISQALYTYEIHDASICANYKTDKEVDILRYLRLNEFLEPILNVEVLSIFLIKSLDYCYRKSGLSLEQFLKLVSESEEIGMILKCFVNAKGSEVCKYWRITGFDMSVFSQALIYSRLDEAIDMLNKLLKH